MSTDPDFGDALFAMERVAPVRLRDRFLVPPFSTLDRRSGEWQARKRLWLSMGIESEVGRTTGLAYGQRGETAEGQTSDVVQRMMEINGGTSVFDPVLVEVGVRWFSRPGDQVLDPFAGGSVRGIVTSHLERHYTGVDLRYEQVAANRAQGNLALDGYAPHWITGDSARLETVLDEAGHIGQVTAGYDMILTCPPYADLEVYSDLPQDLSVMDDSMFDSVYARIIENSVSLLKPNRYAVWVISDVRDKRKGHYRGLVADTITAFQHAGAELLNEFIIIDPVGTAQVRAARPFQATRKAARLHQVMLVFCKGDIPASAQRLSDQEVEPNA